MATEVRVPASGTGGKGTSWKEVHGVSGGDGLVWVVSTWYTSCQVTELSIQCPFNACKRFLNKSVKGESDIGCPMAGN